MMHFRIERSVWNTKFKRKRDAAGKLFTSNMENLIRRVKEFRLFCLK